MRKVRTQHALPLRLLLWEANQFILAYPAPALSKYRPMDLHNTSMQYLISGSQQPICSPVKGLESIRYHSHVPNTISNPPSYCRHCQSRHQDDICTAAFAYMTPVGILMNHRHPCRGSFWPFILSPIGPKLCYRSTISF